MLRLTCLAVLLLSLTLSGQTAMGQIASTVQTSLGDPHSGVTVTVISPALIEKSRVSLTDQKGQYSFINLPQGIYRTEFEFRVQETERQDVRRPVTAVHCAMRDKIALLPGETIQVDAVLAVCREEPIIPIIGGQPKTKDVPRLVISK